MVSEAGENDAQDMDDDKREGDVRVELVHPLEGALPHRRFSIFGEGDEGGEIYRFGGPILWASESGRHRGPPITLIPLSQAPARCGEPLEREVATLRRGPVISRVGLSLRFPISSAQHASSSAATTAC